MIQNLDRPGYFLNRNLSWLQFNRRVLEEAQDPSVPLLERVKMLAITASNLDEFLEIRVAAVLQRMEDGLLDAGPDGLLPRDEISKLAPLLHDFVGDQYVCWNEQLKPALREYGVSVLAFHELGDEAQGYVEDYCSRELDPLLTPVTVDPAHPFPRVINKALCQALLLRRKRRPTSQMIGVITVPRALPRYVRVPAEKEEYTYIALADLVALHAASMYRGYEIVSEGAFRVTRNSNLYLQEEESRNLLESVRAELHNRRKGDAVRLEIEAGANSAVVRRLQQVFDLDSWQVFRTPGPVNLSRLMAIYAGTHKPELKYPPFAPREWSVPKPGTSIFAALKEREILLHHPFDSFKPVVDFIRAAAEDPNVLSIKQTLYRTNPDSPVVEALIDAASRKEVVAVVEVKARFDEASNIRWAREMEDAGVQVFHGLVGLKTHCKICLVARKDPDGKVRRYAHLGTGNYNPVTAGLYTDISLFTADEPTCASAAHVFNFLTAYSEQKSYDPLVVAPLNLAERVIALIGREAEHARAGRPAAIVAKMNSLFDKDLIKALYRASQAGVQIDLIVRGVCGLNPGIPGVSSRIRVRSIVGRYLEHSRIFWFANGGTAEVYVGSADWMSRNLHERVELIFPITGQQHCSRMRDEILAAYLADTAKARILHRGGNYTRPRQTTKPFNAQQFLACVAEGRLTAADIPPPRVARRRNNRST